MDLRQLPDADANYVTNGSMVGTSLEELENSNFKRDFVYTTRELNITSKYFFENLISRYYSASTSSFYNGIDMICIPDCYKWAYNDLKKAKNKRDVYLSIKELEGINGKSYIDYSIKNKFNEDIDSSSYNGNMSQLVKEYGKQKPIKKGDVLEFKALTLLVDRGTNVDETIIANSKTGMGSNCKNVKENIKDNYNIIIKPIDTLDNAKKNLTFDQFSKIEVNGENEHPLYTYLKDKQKKDIINGLKNKMTMKAVKKISNTCKKD